MAALSAAGRLGATQVSLARWRSLYDIIAFDVATILMINFAKLHILTECYGDSAKDKRDLLTSREKHYMLERPPGFWDFTHYFMLLTTHYCRCSSSSSRRC